MGSPASQRKDIGRSESLRVVSRAHRIFRPSDLIHGEVLGKGCFGQAIKVGLGGHKCHEREVLGLCVISPGVSPEEVAQPLPPLPGDTSGDRRGDGHEGADPIR